VLGVSLVAAVAPASAGVLAYRTSDGSADPAFIKLGAFTTVERVVPDGAHGAYLIGSIAVNGAQRTMVHLHADGSVDPKFLPVIRGGRIVAAAVRGSQIAVAGSFTAIGGRRRAGVAVLAADSGRALAWRPVVPGRVRSHLWGDVAFVGSTLVASTEQRVYAWRAGASDPAWKASIAMDAFPARLVAWRGSVMALRFDPRSGMERLAELASEDGRWRDTGIDVGYAHSLQNIGGRLLALMTGGVVVAVGDKLMSGRLASCGQVAGSSGVVAAFAGDARTLYAGDAPASLSQPGVVPGVTACPFDGGATAFTPPPFAYAVHEPLVNAIALVGRHVLVFTKRL
jgi:hypothetical protein